MISESAEPGGTQRVFVIQPNPPIPWHTLLRIFGAMAAFVIMVAMCCAFMGLPLVLPFAGLEVSILGAGLYLSARRGSVREVILVQEREVLFQAGRTGPERSASFQRPWVQVVLERHSDGWYPGRLLLRSHGRQVEVGKFLGDAERFHLAQRLRGALQYGEILETRVQTNSFSTEKCRGLEHEA